MSNQSGCDITCGRWHTSGEWWDNKRETCAYCAVIPWTICLLWLLFWSTQPARSNSHSQYCLKTKFSFYLLSCWHAKHLQFQESTQYLGTFICDSCSIKEQLLQTCQPCMKQTNPNKCLQYKSHCHSGSVIWQTIQESMSQIRPKM